MPTDDPVKIYLDAKRWAQHKQWLADAPGEERARRHAQERQRERMLPENSTILPASNVWVCHGMAEYLEFTEEEVEAGWPDEVIWRDCPPQPVVGWRVSNVASTDRGLPDPPNFLVPDGEEACDLFDTAFGDSPQAAIAGARRLLRQRRELEMDVDRSCAAAGHRDASIRQLPDAAVCSCRQRRVIFVEPGSDEGS